MKLQDIVADTAKKLKTKLQLDQQGICHLLINEAVTVTLERSLDDKSFFLYGIVANNSYAPVLFSCSFSPLPRRMPMTV